MAPQKEPDEEILEAVDVRPKSNILPPRLDRSEREDDYEEDDFDHERPAPRRRRRRQAERGSGKVVLAIVGGSIGVLVLVGFVVGIGYTVISQLNGGPVPASAWQPFTPPNGAFTVTMPGAPTFTTQNIGGLQLHVYTVMAGRTEYSAMYCDLPPGTPVNFDVAIQGACNASGGTVTSKKDLSIGRWKGKGFESDVTKPSKGHSVHHILLANNRLIQLIVVGSNLKGDNPDVIKFVNSLQVGAK
jgi:hypothetical protein